MDTPPSNGPTRPGNASVASHDPAPGATEKDGDAGPAPDAGVGSGVDTGAESGVGEDDWLSLLAADVGDVGLNQHHAALLVSARDASTRAAVDRAAANAAKINQHLAARRAQAREMTALNSLARRLASLREPRELLQEVAAQSRQLVGVDVAYIMVVTPEKDLRIDIVDGSMGSALRGIVLREGEGLGGEVIRSGEPLWSETYLHDARLRRIGSVDAAAASEQLGGILGVPLQVDEESLGVLCVADRRPRRFTEHDVELLAHLAAHAAVALRNARLFEALGETNAALVRTNAARQRASDLRQMLTVKVIGGAGLADICGALSQALGHPTLVVDLDGRRLDRTGMPAGISSGDVARLQRDGSKRVALEAGTAPARLVQQRVGDFTLALTPVVLSDGYAGGLVVVAVDPVDEDTAQLLQIGATSVALVLAHERTLAESELRARGELVNALLSDDVDHASVRRRAQAAGIDFDAVRSVVVFDPGDRDFRGARLEASRVAEALGGWAAEHAGKALLLVPGLDPLEVKQHLVAKAEGDHHAAGIAAANGSIAAVRAGYESARQTSSLLVALGRENAVAVDDELGVYRSLFSHAGRDDVTAFIRATVGALLDYDVQYNRDLTETLEAYLASAQHHVRASAKLHIHSNTLYQRLGRIDELLGDGWREPHSALQIQLALQMRSLAASLASPAD